MATKWRQKNSQKEFAMLKRFLVLSVLFFSFPSLAYEVINIRNTSIHGRNRVDVTIVDETATTRDLRLNVVKQTIEDILKEVPIMVITVNLIASKDLLGAGGYVGQGNYFADGCGFSGKDCNDTKLDIKASDIKLTKKQIQIWVEIIKVGNELEENGIFDDAPLEKQVAKNLGIKRSEVKVPRIELK